METSRGGRFATVNITAFGVWQMLLGRKSFKLRAGRTLGSLVEELGRLAGQDIRKEVVTVEGTIDKSVKIFVNGIERDDLNSSIVDDDDVVLFSAIDGG